MFDAQTFSIIFAGLSIGIAAIYYMLTLRNSQRAQRFQMETRQAQMFMQLFQQDIAEKGPHSIMDLLSWEYENADDFNAKYGREANPEANKSWEWWQNYMEGMGVLVREGYINIRLIALQSSGAVKNLWRKYKPLIYEERERHNWPRWGIEFEYLYDTLMDYAEKHPELQI